jgi:hypothetical protein
MVASICGVFGQKKSISGISRMREGGQGQRGSSGTYDVAVIYDERQWICGPPVKNFNGLAASQATGGEGKGRGDRWLFIEENGAAFDGWN